MKGTSLDDVIAAISTPPGRGGIGIVRMSGSGCIKIADNIFKSKSGKCIKNSKSHSILYGNIVDPQHNNNIVDEVLLSIMKEPNTYTKEDIVEINCHGGILVVQKVLETVLNNGARLAEGGEFTKRAFLNGRIDLTQAEAVIDVINSKTDLSRKAALNQLEGNLKITVRNLRDKILTMIATIEAAIDYPEHEIEQETYINMKKDCSEILTDIDKLLSSSDKGKIIREGIETVILGKPNVGKSSLLNRFLDEERSIVTEVPGTTRDTVEEYINIEGIPIKIVDTAGIRKTDDIVEKLGVEKSKNYAEKADLILMMIDISKDIENDDIEILKLIENKKALVLLNKIDLKQTADLSQIYKYAEKCNVISLSVLENKGINELTNRLKHMFFQGEIDVNEDIYIGNVRHKNSLFYAGKSMGRAIETINNHMPEDFISMDLQECYNYLGEITGDSIDEEIIDRIFSQFCLGK